jgi:hypothetical protein
MDMGLEAWWQVLWRLAAPQELSRRVFPLLPKPTRLGRPPVKTLPQRQIPVRHECHASRGKAGVFGTWDVGTGVIRDESG